MSEPLINGFTPGELAQCAHRELALRRSVYPRRVKDDMMSRAEADQEILKMQAIAQHFLDLQQPELFWRQPPL